MRTNEIIKEIQKLPLDQRILVVEKTIHSLRSNENSTQMRNAAKVLYVDYKSDKELVAFSDLDFEDFYETR